MRNEDMYDTNSLMFEISELRKKNEKLEADKKALTKQLALCSVVVSEAELFCECTNPDLEEPHLGDGGYDWCKCGNKLGAK